MAIFNYKPYEADVCFFVFCCFLFFVVFFVFFFPLATVEGLKTLQPFCLKNGKYEQN